MKPIIIKINTEGKIEYTEQEIADLIEKVYQIGKEDGANEFRINNQNYPNWYCGTVKPVTRDVQIETKTVSNSDDIGLF